MQTFLPYSDFTQVARHLDYRRLGKQRVEAFQLLLALNDSWALAERQWRIDQGLMKNKPLSNKGWVNHPATKMWRGHEQALRNYYNTMIEEWIVRGYNNTMRYAPIVKPITPKWLGDKKFHASHRSNLIRKDPIYYGQFDWPEDASLEYVWPKNNER